MNRLLALGTVLVIGMFTGILNFVDFPYATAWGVWFKAQCVPPIFWASVATVVLMAVEWTLGWRWTPLLVVVIAGAVHEHRISIPRGLEYLDYYVEPVFWFAVAATVLAFLAYMVFPSKPDPSEG